jgi:hypothetical protein
MTAWARFWLFPVGSLGTIALLSLLSTVGAFLALAWGFAVVPLGVAYLHSRSPSDGDDSGLSDVKTDYWRTTLR